MPYFCEEERDWKAPECEERAGCEQGREKQEVHTRCSLGKYGVRKVPLFHTNTYSDRSAGVSTGGVGAGGASPTSCPCRVAA